MEVSLRQRLTAAQELGLNGLRFVEPIEHEVKKALKPLQSFKGLLLSLLVISLGPAMAQTVTVGAGSYTTALPAGAAAPQSTIYSTAGGPIPTHKFWTSKYWNPLGTTSSGGPVYMFPHPLGMQTNANGLKLGFYNGVINGGTYFNQPFQNDLTLGVSGLNASAVNVSATHDWSVDFNWGSAMTATVGRGFPFVYVKTGGQAPTVTFSGTPTVFSQNANILGVSIGGNNYGLFCPTGGTWSGIGSSTLTCTPPGGHNYFSLALLPNQAALSTFAGYAFSFPTNTQVSWSYNPSSSTVSTTYAVSTQAMEGSQTGFLMALYPHQYTSLSGGVNTAYTYASPRGTMEVQSGTSFTTTDTYHGILPFLPPTGSYSTTQLSSLLNNVVTESNHFTGTETYGLGKQLNRVAQLMPIAGVVNNNSAMNSLKSSLEGEMQSWFTATGGKSTNLFFYDQPWGTLIGYPASYGSDTSLNDHHFHYGYWIQSAALTGLVDPNWLASSNWGGMVDLLRQDIANTNRSSTMFPFLKHFDVYAGHSWASGSAPFGDGGNEESSSEAVNAWVGLILYGVATGNTQVRDTGIWLYTMETNSVFDYWFNDGPVATFPSGFNHTTVANVFDAKSDTGTWFGGQPDFEHGIEFLPFTGGSLYLGRDPSYVQRNYNELYAANGNNLGPNEWPDIMEEFEALVNPTDALNNWNNTTSTFDGETRAHEYYWLTELQTLGQVDTAVTANTPLYAVFKNGSTVTHAAYNAGTSAVSVAFSDGHTLNVPAGSIASEFGTLSLSTGVSTAPSTPSAPSGLTATANSGSQVTLTWSASSTSGVTYNLYRSTTSGFTPSSTTLVANGLGSTTYVNTGLTAATTYYYVVRAANSAGESASSNQATVTTSAGSGTSSGAPIFINAGGSATGSWVADVDFSGGTVAAPVTATINTSLIPSPVPPPAVYQTERYGPMTYTIGGLTPGHTYTVQLHFAETYWSTTGQRRFNVLINGNQVLTNFDILANAGGMNKAVEQNLSGTANGSGVMTLQFTTGNADLPKVDGIAVF